MLFFNVGDILPLHIKYFIYYSCHTLTLFNAAPMSSPFNVTATVISSTEIMVNWSAVPPIDQNGVITKYEVQYKPMQTFNGAIETQTVNVNASELSVTLMGLEEFVNYTISVRAYTSAGEGPYSEEVTVMTLEGGKYAG